MLRQLAAGALPVYQVVKNTAEVLEDVEPAIEGKPVAQPTAKLPIGALALVRERLRRPDGWWLLLESGGCLRETVKTGNVPEKLVVRRDKPFVDEVRALLRSSRPGTPVRKHARAVAAQVGVSAEDVPFDRSSVSSTASLS